MHCNLKHNPTPGRRKDLFSNTIIEALSHSKLSSLGLLDKDAFEYISSSGLSCRLVLFPDFTNLSSEKTSTLADRIVHLASGRSIVLLAGHLHRRKGLLTLATISSYSQCQDWYFVFIGEVDWDSYSKVEQSFLKTLAKQENVFTHFSRVSESDMNHVIQRSSLIYAAYLDFAHSSNMLTKSAAYNIPVVVSSGFLMERLVKDYDLGFVISQEDLYALKELLTTFKLLIEKYHLSNSKRQDFLLMNSIERLPLALCECLNSRI